jgi:hypothetical protein
MPGVLFSLTPTNCGGITSLDIRLEAILNTVYVKCKVLPGLFDTEYYVLVNRSSSAYVIRSSVKTSKEPEHGIEIDGQVLAYVIEQDKNRSLVELPGEAVVGGLRTWIPNEMLAVA